MIDCDCRHSDCNCGSSNSGFVFGLICGAIIGAVIAVIIYKNNKAEVFEKLEQKIRSFFEDIIPKTESNETPKLSPKKIIATKSDVETIKPIFVKAKKPIPKTFIKPKK